MFDYCDTLWDTVNSSLATRLQKLNNRASRVLGYEIKTSEIRNQLGWSTLQERGRKHISTLMYKILHNDAPNYLKQLHFYMTFAYYLFDNDFGLKSKYCLSCFVLSLNIKPEDDIFCF